MKKLSELVKEANWILGSYGDMPLAFQEVVDVPMNTNEVFENLVLSTPDVFAVPEEYEDGFVLNIRNWPY